MRGVRLKVSGIIGNFGGQEVVGELRAELVEPEEAKLGEDDAFVRDAVGHDHVIGADAIGGDDEQGVAKIVDVTHLAAPNREGEGGLKDGRVHVAHGGG